MAYYAYNREDPLLNTIISSYRIDAFLGKGSYGIVYKALYLPDDTYWALKLYPAKTLHNTPQLKKYLDNQIAAMQSKYHPNLVALKEVIEHESGVWLVQEYCDLGDLKDYLKNKKNPLKEEEAIDILRQLVKGFEYLYRMGLMHRDFKTRNVFVKTLKNNKISFKIGDFDFIKFGEADTPLGSLYYIAPEVLDIGISEYHKKFYENKIDIWSLGIVYYEILYGRVPFKGKTWLDQFNVINNGHLELDGISMESEGFIRKCLKLNPQERIDWEALINEPLIKGIKEKGVLYERNRILDGWTIIDQEFDEGQETINKKGSWWSRLFCLVPMEDN